MDIRPQDLPEIRAEIVRLRTDIGPEGIALFRSDSVISNRLGMDKAAMIEMETWNVGEADLYHVSREMTDLAMASAPSLPLFAVDAQDFPSKHGLIYFDGGVPANWGGHPVTIYAVTWQVLADFGAAVAYYTDAESFRSSFQATLDAAESEPYLKLIDNILCSRGAARDGVWPMDIVRAIAAFVSENDERYGETEGIAQDGIAIKVWPVVRAALLLMQQTLARASVLQPDRAAKKRLRRSGHEPSDVRVIELRRPKAAPGTGDSGREYHHRWITRGHWRQQWFPKREVHRPVWIAPHIKGPEGAPLIGGEKVYALKR